MPRVVRLCDLCLVCSLVLYVAGCGDDQSDNAGVIDLDSSVAVATEAPDDTAQTDPILSMDSPANSADPSTIQDASPGPLVGLGTSETDEANTNPGLVDCEENENIARLRPILSGGRTHPTGRGEQGSAYDPCNQRIILFGGNDFQPEACADFGPKRFQGDTWMYSLEDENWARIDGLVTPHPRGRHNMVLDSARKRIYLFGGRYREQPNQGAYRLFNDLWAFDLNTDTWQQLQPTGDIPSGRSNAAMVYDDLNDQVILFGGSTSTSGLSFQPQRDTFILNPSTLVWRRVTGGNPPAILFHSMAVLSSTGQVLAYGGGDENAYVGPFFGDVWAFDLEVELWSKVWRAGSGFEPGGRINSALVEDESNNRVILFAGHDDTAIGHRNDVWAFHPEEGWTLLDRGDTGAGQGCDAFCSCPPDFVNVDVESPERRQYQTFEAVPDEGYAILFGGKGDCGYLDDTWTFDFSSETWTETEPAGQGEACMRTGQEGCTDLCY